MVSKQEFKGHGVNRIRATLDEDNDLCMEDLVWMFCLPASQLVAFYTWLGDHMEARGLLDG